MFKRRNVGIPLLESLLARQEGLEGLLQQRNPFLESISQSLIGAQGQAQSLRGGLDQLPGLLKSSALASTQGAQVAAVQAARGAGAGRGGLAFGGGAGAIAARAAQQAASGQSAALAQALFQGEQAKAGFNLQQAGLEGGIAQSLAQARGMQAGIFEQRQGAQAGAITNLQQLLMAQAGLLQSGRPSSPSGLQKFGQAGAGFNQFASGLGNLMGSRPGGF
jgi:hypothetical protein